MKIQVKKDLEASKHTSKQAKKDEQVVSQEQIKTFLRQYELRKLSLNDMYKIYAKNTFTPYFENTLKSAVILIFLPALTNIYYTFRSGSPFAKVMPFAMPFICLTQYFYVINKDFERFCFNNTEDAKELREKYKILYAYSLQDKIIDNVVEDIIQMEEKEKTKTSEKVV